MKSIFKAKPSPAATPAPSKAVAALEAAKQTVEAMAAKLDTARRHAENLAGERARVALAAHTGDEKARKRLDEINSEIGLHASEVASIEAALAEAGANVKIAEDSVAAEKRGRQEAEARRISDLLIAESARFDRAAAEMVDALHRRRDLHRELTTTGVLASGVHNQLVRTMTIHRALGRAGIGDFTDMNTGGNAAHSMFLAEHDSKILGRPTTPAKVA